MRNTLLLALLALLLAACSPQASSSDSGIYGQVVIGPTCPVERPGLDCADRPYQATLSVLTPAGKRVARFTTAQDGTFRINIAPGDYILHPETPQGQTLPVAPEQPFTVESGKFTQLAVSYDSGIR